MVSVITINGVTITADSGNVSIVNGKVIVDGKEIKIGDGKIHEVNIQGDVNNLKCTGNVEVHGNVKGSVDAGGSVVCNDVDGSIDAGGSVKGSRVGGDIDAGGSVHISK